jgi:hypothetical protein
MLELSVDGFEVFSFCEEFQSVWVHAQVEHKDALVEEEIGLIENVAFLDAESFSWVDLLLSLFIALSSALAGFLQ